MKILLLGSSGLLGKNLYLSISKKFNTYHNGLFKRKRDLNKTKNVELLLKCKPSIVINCLGETDIEKCEINNKNCYQKNVKFLKMIISEKS